jgi:DNA-binding XRE family transcriptional regulator
MEIEKYLREIRREFEQLKSRQQSMEMTAFENLGEKIRLERKKQQLTVKELSDLSGVAYPSLVKLENGSSAVQLNSLLKVLNTLGIKLWLG